MKKVIATAFIASAGLALVSSAQAMPVAPLDQPDVGAVIQVFGGCGWDGHRGPFGGCRPLYNCPPGWHTGPWGRVCTPVYPVGPAPVYPVGPAPVYPVGPAPVYPVGPAPVYPVGPAPVYPVGPAPVYPVGPAPVYPVGPPPQPVYPGGDNGPPAAGPACGCDGPPQGPPVGQPWRGRGS
jgi:hypothetical protein